MADREQVLHVDHVLHKVVDGLQALGEGLLSDELLKVVITRLGHPIEDVCEEILHEAHEDHQVIARDLGQVEVAKRAHEQTGLGRDLAVHLGPKEGARHLEHRADGA